MTTNPAFDYLRQFKPVDAETENLVLKKCRQRGVTTNQLMVIFENGIAGQYGKVYSCDPATLLGWVDKSQAESRKISNYLDTPLLPAETPVTSTSYPRSKDEWNQETNKAFNAYLRGVTPEYFHPHIYDHLVLDNRIHTGTIRNHLRQNYLDQFDPAGPVPAEITRAYQASIGDYFANQRRQGKTQIYTL